MITSPVPTPTSAPSTGRPRHSMRGVYAAAVLLALVVVGAATVYAARGPIWFDQSVWSTVIAHRSDAATTVAEFVSTLLNPVGTVVIAAICAVLLVVRDRSAQRAIAVLGGVAGAACVAEVLKLLVARARPPMDWQLEAHEAASSFPSGHTTGAAALAFVLALVLAPAASRVARGSMLALAAVIAVSTALSRVYLGMHWSTDVIAGVVVGLAAALVAPAVAAWLAPYVDAAGHALLRRKG